MTFSQSKQDALWLTYAALWVVITILALTGLGYYAIFFSVIVIALPMVNGLVDNGKMNDFLFKRLFLVWLIQFCIGTILMVYFEITIGESQPPFLILGMHPSFFCWITFYWSFSVITINGTLALYRDVWLSDERWNQFFKDIGKEASES